MTKYIATFAEGTSITRKSDRLYAAAWRATWCSDDGTVRVETGFSVSAAKVQAYRPMFHYVSRFMSANERARAKRLNAAFLARSMYQVEIVPAVAA